MYKDIEFLILLQLSYVDIIYQEGDSLLTIIEKSNHILSKDNQRIKSIMTHINTLDNQSSLFHLTIKKYTNQNQSNGNGFVGYIFENKSNQDLLFIFRGSENIGKMKESQIDMIDNLAAAFTGDSSQIKEAKQFFAKYNLPTANQYVLGHSKGGNLAAEVFLTYQNLILKLVTINGQPVNRKNMNDFEKELLNSKKHDCIVASGDIVSWLGYHSWQQKRRYVKTKEIEKNIFDAHSLENIIVDEQGYFIEEPWPYVDQVVSIINKTTSTYRCVL